MDDATTDPISLLVNRLVRMKILPQNIAQVYAVGLRHGVVTSSDIAQALDVRASTAGNRLQSLLRSGYFTRSLREGEEKKSGKGHAIRYAVVPPEQALKGLFDDSKELANTAAIVEEGLELKAESSNDIGDIWLAEAEHLVFSKGIEKIKGAKSLVQISSHDCSWLDDDQVIEAITNATKRKVRVKIAVSEITSKLKQSIRHLGASYIKSPIPAPIFCIIDKSILLVPYRPRIVREGYHLLVTTHKYLVSEFVRYFEGLSSLPLRG